MIRSSFCVVLCGEAVNVRLRLRNISNSTEPREKKIHGRTTRVATPYICSYPAVVVPSCTVLIDSLRMHLRVWQFLTCLLFTYIHIYTEATLAHIRTMQPGMRQHHPLIP
jgi:hypothetical protein